MAASSLCAEVCTSAGSNCHRVAMIITAACLGADVGSGARFGGHSLNGSATNYSDIIISINLLLVVTWGRLNVKS